MAGNNERDTMSNKQVIAIFFAGVCMLAVAFWAGLSISRHGRATVPDTTAGSKAGQVTASAAPNGQDRNSTSQSRPSPTGEEDQNARFIVQVAAFGTRE